MSELKAYKMVNEKYCTDCVCVIPVDVYFKSEADKVIAHHKYKRCMAMAKWCIQMMVFNSKYGTDKKWHLFKKWHKRWLELAEKFKEEKC